MSLRRRGLFATAIALSAPGLARAQQQRPIVWVVPFGPGSIPDVTSRLIAQKLALALGQPVVVENRPGAGGSLGTAHVARQPPDGHTVFFGSQGTLAVAPFIFPQLAYDPARDFQAVHGLGASPNMIVVGADRPWRTLAELMAAARADPGGLNCANTGPGTGVELAAQNFELVTGVRFTHVPYTATPQAQNDIITGRVDLMFDYPLTARGHIQGGRLRPLAVTADQRLVQWPDVPSMPEAGAAGAEFTSWAGLYTLAGTPQPVLRRLEQGMAVAMRDDAVRELFDSTGTIRWHEVGADAMGGVLAPERERMRAILRRLGRIPA